MKRIYCLALVMSLAVGCTKKGKSCPDDGDCGDKLSCEPVTKTCQATCAKWTDCEQGFTCDMAQFVCFSPRDQKAARKEAEAAREKARKEAEAAREKARKEAKAVCEKVRKEAKATRKKANEKVRAEIIASFVSIPGGSFEMGSTGVRFYHKPIPIHSVTVTPFEITATEVTVAQYRACVDDEWCSEPGTGFYECNWNVEGRENHPINCVDWGQAHTFAKWVGADVDLPTEAEWEYAARGGQDFIYAGSNNPDEVGWHGGNAGDSTHPVGTKQANGYGLYDMSGNVREWILDEWHKNYEGAPTVSHEAWGEASYCSVMYGKGPARRVTRGGGWRVSALGLHVAHRDRDNSPDDRYDSLGFRLRRTR